MDTRVISKIQERLERDSDAFKRVLQSFGITKNPLPLRNFSSIFQLFPDTPVTMLKDVFEALQLYDLLELLELKSAIKPHTSLQLAYTLDGIKKMNGVADLPTTYHSCGAVLIITNDANVSSASAIKTFFTDLDNKSDVTEILIQEFEIPILGHLYEEISAMMLEISARFGNLLEGETQRQTEVPLSLFLSRLKDTLDELKQITHKKSGHKQVLFALTQLRRGTTWVQRELKQIVFVSLSEDKELTRFLQSMIVTAEKIQANLTKLMQRSDLWFFKEVEKEKKNFRENVSSVINRWIHRQG